MNTNMKAGKTGLAFITLLFLGSFYALPLGHAPFVPPSGWQSYEPVTFTETNGLARVDEPVDILFEPTFGNCSSVNEIRVIAPNQVTEVPSQVYDVVTDSGYITSCRVVFLASCAALTSVTYYIIYNNPSATAPVYDGLRLHTELVGDTYNITTKVAGIEKNYCRLFWKHLMDLYSNGTRVCWPGGLPGWEFAQIFFASLWSDGAGNPWFSVGDILTVVDSGPLFVDFNITQPFASDIWATVFNHNVSTTYMIRVYYQPDLNPLIGYHMSQKFKHKDTVENPVAVDFKLANSTSYEIYQDFTWKNVEQEVTTVSAKSDMPQIDSIWSAAKPYGWFSYNGSIPGMPDKPVANIGLIPTYAGGTSPTVDYIVNFTARYPNTPQEPYYNHHCTTQFSAVTHGVEGDVIETKGFINTYTPLGDAEPTMSNTATRLRVPLIRIVDITPPIIDTPSQNPDSTAVEPYQNVNVTVGVTDEESGVSEVLLFYSTDEGQTWTNVTMDNTEGNTYLGQIPGFEADTHVQYKIIAYDNANNLVMKDNNKEYYVYTVIPEFPSFLILPLFMVATLLGVIVHRRKHSM